MSAALPHTAELRRRLAGLNLYLVGMMGSGKSAVGAPLAAALGYRFIDADSSIEQVAGRPIPAIFRDDGEPGFRALETAVLGQIAHWHSLVVATGGGIVTQAENWGHLRQGVVIWLEAPRTLLLERLKGDPTPRPLLETQDADARLDALLQEREALYDQADLRILQHPGASPQQVAEQVLAALPAILKDPQATPGRPAGLIDADGHSVPSCN